MVDSIKGGLIKPVAEAAKAYQNGTVADAKGSFSTVLQDSIQAVNKVQHEADAAIQGLAKGEVANIHDTMIAVEKASVSFNMMVQVRNKLVAAYEEIMRMQV